MKINMRKREIREEKLEAEEKKALEDFKVLRKKTEKRQRENSNRLENQPRIEPLMKRRRLTPSRLENKWTEGELDLGKWLARAEERCLRVGMLTERLEREREEVLKKIEDYRKREATQQIPDYWRNKIQDTDHSTCPRNTRR